MTIMDWARQIRPELVRLQQRTGIPALFAAAQFCHESAVDGGAVLSELARLHHNYAGLKWAEWQRAYGCKSVAYGTWEEIDGQRVDLGAAFCSCPSWEVWLQVYAALLTGRHYAGALRYSADPYLYGREVWGLGWATDSRYLDGLGEWMAQLWTDYAATIPAPPRQKVVVVDAGGRLLCEGRLEIDHTVVDLRDIAGAQGLQIGWTAEPPTAVLMWPGEQQKK